jgi:PAS domain S-box-containing protein
MAINDLQARVAVDIVKQRQAELKYRTVADFTYDWEYWADFDGKLIYVSPSCERISGYTVQEFMDDPSLCRKIIAPEDQGIWDQYYRDSRTKLIPRELQFRIRRRDGEIRWIEHVCQPVYDDDGNAMGFRASNRDNTERKRFEEALVQSKDFNQRTLNSLPYHIAVLDREGSILDVNANWERFARENAAPSTERVGRGVNYLEVCRCSAASGDALAETALEGIRSVLERSREGS